MRERPFLELASLRGEATTPDFVTALERVTGTTLPMVPNTVVEGDAYIAWWLGPDEWLLQSQTPRDATLEKALRPLLQGMVAAVVDVSSGSTVIELTGRRVRDVLRKGCPLDMHPRVFGVGQCAHSHYFKAAIALRPLADDAYALIVRRSYAEYMANILMDASGELL